MTENENKFLVDYLKSFTSTPLYFAELKTKIASATFTFF